MGGVFPNEAPRILLAGRVVAVGDYVEVDGDLVRNIGETLYVKMIPP